MQETETMQQLFSLHEIIEALSQQLGEKYVFPEKALAYLILAALFPQSGIADGIHHALWTLSRRFGLRIFVGNGPGGKQVEVVKMSEAANRN
jgi:hypothetical protein